MCLQEIRVYLYASVVKKALLEHVQAEADVRPPRLDLN
jgi:hypothetical protein